MQYYEEVYKSDGDKKVRDWEELISDLAELRQALAEIRDEARSTLKPDALSEREYYQSKLSRIASIASSVLAGSGD